MVAVIVCVAYDKSKSARSLLVLNTLQLTCRGGTCKVLYHHKNINCMSGYQYHDINLKLFGRISKEKLFHLREGVHIDSFLLLSYVFGLISSCSGPAAASLSAGL